MVTRVMPEPFNYEAAYLTLSQRFKGLASECPCIGPQYWRCSECERKKDGTPIHNAHKPCATCYQGSGRVPLPEAERLGALVEATQTIRRSVIITWDGSVYAVMLRETGKEDVIGYASKPWQALTMALLAS